MKTFLGALLFGGLIINTASADPVDTTTTTWTFDYVTSAYNGQDVITASGFFSYDGNPSAVYQPDVTNFGYTQVVTGLGTSYTQSLDLQELDSLGFSPADSTSLFFTASAYDEEFIVGTSYGVLSSVTDLPVAAPETSSIGLFASGLMLLGVLSKLKARRSNSL